MYTWKKAGYNYPRFDYPDRIYDGFEISAIVADGKCDGRWQAEIFWGGYRSLQLGLGHGTTPQVALEAACRQAETYDWQGAFGVNGVEHVQQLREWVTSLCRTHAIP
ncbi:MAG TPA: hypothetical protein VI981_00890 [Candidatus Paceibacterota bacterium]